MSTATRNYTHDNSRQEVVAKEETNSFNDKHRQTHEEYNIVNGNSLNLETIYCDALRSLELQRTQLEEEYDKIYQELMTPVKIGYEDDKATDGTMASAPPIGIETQLVDSDGLQRTDIDLVRAHMLRQRYQVLKSDIEALRGQTEELLEKIALAQVMSLSSDTNYRVVSVS